MKKKKVKPVEPRPVIPGAIKTPEPHRRAKDRPHLYDNGYFYIPDYENQQDLKIVIREQWTHAPPGGLGQRPQKSKTLMPSNFGEKREDPRRSWALLKAWMIWRMRYAPGWIDADGGRKRLVADEEELLRESLARCNFRGNDKAFAQLKQWAPELAATV